jgi:hypothetical protein
MNRILITILFTFIGLEVIATPPRDVYTTTSGGSWVNVFNWDLGVPANDQTDGSDDIIITHHITLTDDLTVKSGTNITVEGCDTLHITGNATFNNGSAILVEPCAVLIIDGNLTNNNNSTDIQINGKVIIGGDYDGGTGSELTGTGEMEVEGSVTTDGGATVFGSTENCTVDCDNSNDDPLGDPLPIELIWFTGRVEGEHIILEWATASETNNDYFEIWHSTNNKWENISVIKGAGNSSNVLMYSEEHYGASYGINYYKLVQVDFDGEYDTFNTITINKPIISEEKYMEIWPNPTTSNNDINISLIGFTGEEILIVVMNTLGQIFYEKAVITHDGDNIIVIDSDLPTGTYLVVGSEKQELYRKKLIIR